MFASAKGKKQKQVRQLQCQEPCIEHIPHYLSGLWRAHVFRQPFSKQLYMTLHLGDRRSTASLRYRNRAEITLFISEQKPYPELFLCQRRYSVKKALSGESHVGQVFIPYTRQLFESNENLFVIEGTLRSEDSDCSENVAEKVNSRSFSVFMTITPSH